MSDQAMTRDELKKKINNVARFLTYPDLDDLHAIDDCDATLREELAQLKKLNHPICLNCGAAEPCELKDDPQGAPCTFDLTPKQLHQWCTQLREELAQVKQERDEAKEEVAWYGTLVRRTKIGTHETPSLKAYIEQLEARIAALEGEA